MNRLFIALAGFLILSLNGFSQSDPKAQEILKGVSAKYKSYKSVVAAFKLTIVDQKSKKNEAAAGTITIQGSKFNFAMSDQTVMNDGKTNWTYLKESNEVQISDATSNPDAISPTTIFTMYEKGFKSKFMAEKAVGGKTVQLIQLAPDDAKKAYFRIELSIDKAGKFVNEAKVFNKDGKIITYSIVKFTPNAAVSDDLFTFNKAKYPNVEVVDLR